MSVVNIAKIQIKRGKKHQGSGVPQLSSGEFGWALDTKELFIGNGSVQEGAPSIGNTRILTEHDLDGNEFVDLNPPTNGSFDLGHDYVYLVDSDIQTSNDPNTPFSRSLQERLDETVSVFAFGVTGNGVHDDTNSLQRAIDQLFLGSQFKNELVLPAGVYLISDSIKLPPYTKINGAGVDRTIIKQTTANKPLFVNVNSNGDLPSSTDTYDTQCHMLHINNMTLIGDKSDKVFDLSNCRHSVFENLIITSNWDVSDLISDSNCGVSLESHSVFSQYNRFINCVFHHLSYGISSDSDINNNVFDKCVFEYLGKGVVFGENLIKTYQHSPNNNKIVNCDFRNIHQTGVFIHSGRDNICNFNTFKNVGNNMLGDITPAHHVVVSNSYTNIITDNVFFRLQLLTPNTNNNSPSYFYSDIDGEGIIDCNINGRQILPNVNNINGFLKLPYHELISYRIDYKISGIKYTGTRIGSLFVLVNGGQSNIYDDYQYLGNAQKENIVYFISMVDSSAGILYINVSTLDVELDQSSIIYNINMYSR